MQVSQTMRPAEIGALLNRVKRAGFEIEGNDNPANRVELIQHLEDGWAPFLTESAGWVYHGCTRQTTTGLDLEGLQVLDRAVHTPSQLDENQQNLLTALKKLQKVGVYPVLKDERMDVPWSMCSSELAIALLSEGRDPMELLVVECQTQKDSTFLVPDGESFKLKQVRTDSPTGWMQQGAGHEQALLNMDSCLKVVGPALEYFTAAAGS